MDRFYFVVSLLLAGIIYGHAQNSHAQRKDLKVGLVLSGGGAKGLAHIGVLKVLERAKIRIDYIGGTSMGAIIGALYASGYSADELDSIAKSYDFNVLMQDIVPRRAKSIYQKEFTEKYALSLPIYKKGVQLPTALSKGQNVFNLLLQLTENVHTISDFSHLPIPFFCIATNLETGKEEILETGFLPQAVRASGSFPTLLDPVKVGDKVLVDGGVVNNFPVDIMRQKDVDIIIGVDVQDKLKDVKTLDTALDIVFQIVNFQIYREDKAKAEMADIYIHPNIDNFNVISFDLAENIIKNGIKAAEEQELALRKIAERQITKPQKRIRLETYKPNDYLYLNKIYVNGNKNYTKKYILGKLNLREKDSIRYKEFNEGLNSLSATGNFKDIQYKLVKNDADFDVFFSLTEEKTSNYLQLAVHYDNLYKTGVLLNLTSKHQVFKNDIFSGDVVLGDNIRANVDYFIDNGFHWSYGIKSRYNSFKSSFYENILNDDLPIDEQIDRLQVTYMDFSTKLFLQTAINKDMALQIGGESKYLRAFTETLINNRRTNNYFANTHYLSAYSSFLLDTYDNKNFPKKGLYLDIDYKAYLLSSSFDDDFKPFSQLKGRLSGAFTIGNKFTTHIRSEAGITIGDNNRVFNYFLGGNNENFINNFIPFYGYEVADLSESAFLKTAVTMRYELFKNNNLSFTANAGRVESDLFNKGNIFDNTKLGYAVGYGIDSFLGPIQIKYAWAPEKEKDYWYFNFGFWF